MRCLFTLCLAFLLLMLPAAAMAQSEDADETIEATETVDDAQDPEWTHVVAGTARVIWLPSGILDIWFDKHANTWQDGNSNMAFGAEYTLQHNRSWGLNVAVFWTDLGMPDQFWLETDKPGSAADYTKNTLSTVAAEANFFGYYDFFPEFGMFYGGGFWVGALLGAIEKSNIDADCADGIEASGGNLELCGFDGFFEAEDGLPPVAGFLSASLGLQLQLEKRFVMRLEGGFKGYLFLGMSMGGQFF